MSPRGSWRSECYLQSSQHTPKNTSSDCCASWCSYSRA